MLRLIALYLHYRDLQEERSRATVAGAVLPSAPAPTEAASEAGETQWSLSLAA